MHETMTGGPLTNWLAIIGVISLIYWAWRIVAMFNARGNSPNEHTAGAVGGVAAAPVSMDLAQPVDDIAVIAAAVHAMLGAHRIVHLEALPGGQAWAIEGRWMQQTSHSPR
jgi:hypothetical protein